MMRRRNYLLKENPMGMNVLYLCRYGLNIAVDFTNLLNYLDIDEENDSEAVEYIENVHNYLSDMLRNCIKHGAYEEPYLDNDDTKNVNGNLRAQKELIRRMKID